MASIEVRKRGDQNRWRVVWREDGSKQQLTFTDEAEAQRFRKLVEGSGERWPAGWRPAAPSAPAKVLTFDQWARQAVAKRTRASAGTKADYLRALDLHFTDLASVPLDEIDAARVAAWYADRVAAGLSEKTLRNLHGFASSVMKDALLHRPPLVDHNAFAEHRMADRASVRTEEMTFLTHAEFDLVLGYVPAEYRALIRFLAGTGCRFGEATALTVGDIDLLGKRKTASIVKAWKRTGTAKWDIGEPKTRQSRRTITLGDELVDDLLPLVAGRRRTDLLFGHHGNGAIRLPHTEVWKRAWAPAVARARVCDVHYEPQRDGRGQRPTYPTPCDCPGVLDKSPRIHDLRHSHASWLIAEGLPLPAISRRLGHASIMVTIDRYGHLDPALDDRINDAVDRALGRRGSATLIGV